MNNRIKKCSYAALALAVSMALCSNAYSAAGDSGNSVSENEKYAEYPGKTDKNSYSISVETQHIDKSKKEITESTQHTTTRMLELMSLENTDDYLKNRGYADTSTFPLRLINKLNATPWQEAPISPVSGEALSCFYGIPPYRAPLKIDSMNTPVTVTADSVSGDMANKDKQNLVYEGNVIIVQGDRKIVTGKTTYSGDEQTLTAEGNTIISTGQITLNTDESVVYSLKDRTIDGKNVKYQLNGSVINGSAVKVHSNLKEGTKVYTDATLSGCPADKRSWHLSSGSVEITDGESFGDAYNNVLYLSEVPVFYTPYATFPITSKRKSGLLPISVSYSSGHGIGYSIPVYFNIAPNYDATVTIGRDPKHGNIFDTELRYMPFENFKGSINGTYLPSDRDFTRVFTTAAGETTRTKFSNDSNKRWFLNLKDELTFLEKDLTFKLDYSKVRDGDYTYISDLGYKQATIDDSSLLQSLLGTYIADHYQFSLEGRKYQNMYSNSTFNTFKPFAMLPQFKAAGYDTFGRFSYRMDAEATRFVLEKYDDNNSSDLSMARYHLQPSVKYNVMDSYGTVVNLGVTGFYTRYQQNDLKDLPSNYVQRLGYSEYDSSVSRSLYLLEADAKTTLERKVLDMNHTQTLEPQIKYMYIPYKDQSNIALYDTTFRYDDYYTLFSPYKFAGIDRIANLNVLTAGFTSRLLDSHDRESMRFSLAQAFNFENNKVRLNSTDKLRTQHSSPIEATFDAILPAGLTLHAQAQYDNEVDRFSAYNTALSYHNVESGFKASISYRYFKDGNYRIDDGRTPVDLSQIGVTANIPLAAGWSIFGASYRDLNQNYNIDTKLGIRYDECCYAVSLLFEDYLKYDYTSRDVRGDKYIGINIEFKGLYEINAKGIVDPHGTDTHYIPSLELSNLNR